MRRFHPTAAGPKGSTHRRRRLLPVRRRPLRQVALHHRWPARRRPASPLPSTGAMQAEHQLDRHRSEHAAGSARPAAFDRPPLLRRPPAHSARSREAKRPSRSSVPQAEMCRPQVFPYWARQQKVEWNAQVRPSQAATRARPVRRSSDPPRRAAPGAVPSRACPNSRRGSLLGERCRKRRRRRACGSFRGPARETGCTCVPACCSKCLANGTACHKFVTPRPCLDVNVAASCCDATAFQSLPVISGSKVNRSPTSP